MSEKEYQAVITLEIVCTREELVRLIADASIYAARPDGEKP